MHTSSQDRAIFSIRTLISTVLIIMAIVGMVFGCLVAVHVPCLTNFYNRLPVYPDSQLTDSTMNSLHWVGIGQAQMTYTTLDNASDVELWYVREVDNVIDEAMRARAAGDPVPPVWDHQYVLQEIDNGDRTQITLRAQCLE